MLIALSGTPGCGKTTVSYLLGKRSYDTVDINKISKSKDFVVGRDEARDSDEVDIERLNEFILRTFSEGDHILEGHLSHLLSVDLVILLRCNPLILKKRLEDKGWTEVKIKENMEAEIMDVIKIEAYEEEHRVYEVDTSYVTPDEVVDNIEKIIKGNYESPNIDWLEKYEYLLFQ